MSEASKPFTLSWVDPRDSKGYYARAPLHASHPPWTNTDTATDLAISAIIAQGEILCPNGKINTTSKGIIEAVMGEGITWGAP